MTGQSRAVKEKIEMSEDTKVLLPIRVTRETRRRLKVHAASHDVSVNALLTAAVEMILEPPAATSSVDRVQEA
jgi:hypothetical protein